MDKIILFVIIGIMVLGGTSYVLVKVPQEPIVPDYKNIEYVIAGESIKLGTKGLKYFGNEVHKDLDGDGDEDIAFLVTHEPGGSGTFFYVVAALKTGSEYRGSHGVLIGDRIAPQTTESGTGRMIIVNYAERKPGEPFTARPQVGESIWLLLDPNTMQFGEVVQNFEGEADPSRMTLTMKTWIWQENPHFTITFEDDGILTTTGDCNRIWGAYATSGDAINFTSIAQTKMFCSGSEENEFVRILTEAERYRFTSKGELIFELESGNSAVFK